MSAGICRYLSLSWSNHYLILWQPFLWYYFTFTKHTAAGCQYLMEVMFNSFKRKIFFRSSHGEIEGLMVNHISIKLEIRVVVSDANMWHQAWKIKTFPLILILVRKRMTPLRNISHSLIALTDTTSILKNCSQCWHATLANNEQAEHKNRPPVGLSQLKYVVFLVWEQPL